MTSSITTTLDKIQSREKYINTQLESLIHEFRTQQDTLGGHTDRYKQSSTGVTALTKELTQLSEELETLKAKVCLSVWLSVCLFAVVNNKNIF